MRRGEDEGEGEEAEGRRFLMTWDVDKLDEYVMTPVVLIDEQHSGKKKIRLAPVIPM